jgi:hypothetical protein
MTMGVAVAVPLPDWTLLPAVSQASGPRAFALRLCGEPDLRQPAN